mgnify:CR=1 FL=1
MAKTNRNGTIDLLRFFFCVLIVLRHFNDGMPKDSPMIIPGGGLGVEFFFVVSGYLMACSAYKRVNNGSPIKVAADTNTFMKRKMNGLLPDLIVASVFSIVCYSITLIPRGFKAILIDVAQRIWSPLMLSAAGFGCITELWYLSAMIIAMLVYYPILVKHFDSFVRIIAPLTAIFVIGFMYKGLGSLLNPSLFVTVMHKGMIRAFGEIALGVAIFPLIQSLSAKELTKKAKVLISLGNFLSVLFAFLIMANREKPTYDLLCLAFITLCAIFSFSHQGILADKFDNKFFSWLGKLSLTLYLSHKWIALSMKNVYSGVAKRHWFGLGEDTGFDYVFLLTAYLVCTVIACTVIYLISQYIRKHRESSRKKLKKVFFDTAAQ